MTDTTTTSADSVDLDVLLKRVDYAIREVGRHLQRQTLAELRRQFDARVAEGKPLRFTGTETRQLVADQARKLAADTDFLASLQQVLTDGLQG